MVSRKGYAQVYDDLYQGKQYESECDFIEEIFTKYGARPATILEYKSTATADIHPYQVRKYVIPCHKGKIPNALQE